MTLGKLQRSYSELPWMYRWGNLHYDSIVWNIEEVVGGNTKARTLILSSWGIWLPLPLNQKTVIMLQGNYSLIQNKTKKITMSLSPWQISRAVIQQDWLPPSAMVKMDKGPWCSLCSSISVLFCWCRSPRIGCIQDRLTSTIPEDLRSKAEC